METAQTWRRVLAFWMDSIVAALCFLPVWIQIFSSYLELGVLSVSLSWVLIGLLLQLFYKWLFLYFLGGTLGKLMMGLRVVPKDQLEGSLGLFQSFLRVLTDSLSFFFGQALRSLALIRFDRTHVSDWVAETRVVQYAPRKRPPTRHWILVLIVFIFSFLSQFQTAYQLVQRSTFENGMIVVDANH